MVKKPEAVLPHSRETPFEALQRARRIQSEAAEERIARHGRRFLLLQLMALGTLFLFTQIRWPPDSWVGFVLGTACHASWLFSMYAAGYAAFAAISRISILETAWIVIGLAPWAVLMAEVSLAFLLLVLR